MDWSDRHQAQLLQDVIQRLDRIQEGLNRFRSQRIPDRFLPLNEAVLQMHCGKDWLKAKSWTAHLDPESTLWIARVRYQKDGGI